MNKIEFTVLYECFKNASVDINKLSKVLSVDFSKINTIYCKLKKEKWILGDDQISGLGLEKLRPYKVDNAIIMAAGLSSRCLPLSKVLPKGLFIVKDEVLIEREIRQLKEAGIQEIILVTGYLKEKFEYLQEKFGITIIENTEYKERNNTSSLYAARDYLKNSYICCADNYFEHNIFESYVYDSYYTCKYTEEYLDEFCLTKVEDGYIKEIRRGGQDCFYTMGAVYFSKAFSDKFMSLLVHEYDNENVKGMLIDTFHLIHIDVLPSTFVGYSDDEIKEFDTLKEFAEFDPDFNNFYNETMEKELFGRYKDISRYAGVPTDWLTGRLHYNENLWGPSPKCLDVLYKTTLEDLYLYDSAAEDDLLIVLSEKTGIDKKNLFLHNGSAESIKTLFSVMIKPDDVILLPEPGWSYYSGIVDYKFGKAVFYDITEGEHRCEHNMGNIMELAKQHNPKIIAITSPAMPTGNAISGEKLELIVKSNPGSMVLVDEAYFGFAPYEINVKKLINTYDNIVFSRTFSKYFGLANLRIGYGICSEAAMHALWLDLPLHRLPHISKRMAIAALNDDKYYETIIKETVSVREWFRTELNRLPDVSAYQSDSNFLYIKLSGYNVAGIQKYMKNNGYLIRIFEGHGAEHLRITVAPKEIMEDCLNKLKAAMETNRL